MSLELVWLCIRGRVHNHTKVIHTTTKVGLVGSGLRDYCHEITENILCHLMYSVTTWVELVQKTHDNMHQRQLHVHVATLTGKRIIMHGDCWWKANCIMSSAWNECYMYSAHKAAVKSFRQEIPNVLFFWTCKISYTRGSGWQCWLCALTCECRGSFVTSQRLLLGHYCPVTK